MSVTTTTAVNTGMNSVLSALRAAQRQGERGGAVQAAEPSFITISRQPGISTDAFANHLADCLGLSSGLWKVWDRELVEKISADHHISSELVQSLAKGAGRGSKISFVDWQSALARQRNWRCIGAWPRPSAPWRKLGRRLSSAVARFTSPPTCPAVFMFGWWLRGDIGSGGWRMNWGSPGMKRPKRSRNWNTSVRNFIAVTGSTMRPRPRCSASR